MIVERQALQTGNGSIISPSSYWSDFCSFFDYLLGMDEAYFSKLRLHTYHLTSDNYQFYYFGEKGVFGGRDAFRRNANLDALTEGLPAECVLNEPQGGIGFHYDDGRFISYDVARFQRVVSSLYRHDVLSEMRAGRGSLRLLEIGGGYGGLAHHLSNVIENRTYVIVDLPETLLFSASYLSLLNPQKKVYLYDPSSFAEVLDAGDSAGYDFILVPNYRLQSLKDWDFDLVLNIGSLQEMRTPQAKEYLDFIRRQCVGVFYSWNEDRQHRNLELTNLSALLRERFELIDITEENLLFDPPALDDIDPLVKMFEKLRRSRWFFRRYRRQKVYPLYTSASYREYLCKPSVLDKSRLKSEG